MEEEVYLCPKCGNHHNDDCSTEITYFFWYPDTKAWKPKTVEIVGSWYQWQSQQLMVREVDERGEVHFELGVGLPAGCYEYKYLIDGEWKHREDIEHVPDPYGGYNNYVEVLPKPVIRQYSTKQDIKISTSICSHGLKVVGSWDNWKSQTKMDRVYNNLKGGYENVAYMQLTPNKHYQFKFKIKNQYLVDQNYPTIEGSDGCINNHIYVKDIMSTPTGWRTNKSISNIPLTCRVFEWEKTKVQSEMSLNNQLLEGHSMCQIGQFIYICGGRLKNDFTNRLIRVNIHKLDTLIGEEAMLQEKAFHHAFAYGNKMIIYGGHNTQILQDYSAYNTINQTWLTPPSVVGKFPQKSQNNSCVLYQTFLVLFGGYFCSSDLQIQQTFNQIEVLDIKEMKWVDQESIKVEGKRPQPRYLHTATMIDSDMYVFGGKLLDQTTLSDLWALNLESVSKLNWVEKKPKGRPPLARYGHSSNAIQKFLIIFGGSHYIEKTDKKERKLLGDLVVYDSEKNQWIYPIIKNPQISPAPRNLHGSTTVNNEYIILFGGNNSSYITTSIYSLRPRNENTNLLDIEQQNEQEEQKNKRASMKKMSEDFLNTEKEEKSQDETMNQPNN